MTNNRINSFFHSPHIGVAGDATEQQRCSTMTLEFVFGSAACRVLEMHRLALVFSSIKYMVVSLAFSTTKGSSGGEWNKYAMCCHLLGHFYGYVFK